MSELKASPGPWEYVAKLSPSENHRGFFIRAEKATRNGKWALAEVQPGDEDGKLGKANAALIAAAPELYAALEQMHSMWSAHCRANGWEPDHVAESANAIAALQKARGE